MRTVTRWQRDTRDKRYVWAWQRGDTGLLAFAGRHVALRLCARDGVHGHLRPADAIALAYRRMLWARSRLWGAQTLSYWRRHYIAAGADAFANLHWWEALCQNS